MSRTTLSHVYTKIFMVMLRYIRVGKNQLRLIIVVLGQDNTRMEET